MPREQPKKKKKKKKIRLDPQNLFSLAVTESHDHFLNQSWCPGYARLWLAELSHRWAAEEGRYPTNLGLLLPEKGKCCQGSKKKYPLQISNFSAGQVTRTMPQWDPTNINSIRQRDRIWRDSQRTIGYYSDTCPKTCSVGPRLGEGKWGTCLRH